MNVETGNKAAQFQFSNICFQFSVPCVCSVFIGESSRRVNEFLQSEIFFFNNPNIRSLSMNAVVSVPRLSSMSLLDN
jgi:hypothetical protein